MRTITKIDRALLMALDEKGGLTTGDVSRIASITYASDNARQRSGAVRSWLQDLKKDGLVWSTFEPTEEDLHNAAA